MLILDVNTVTCLFRLSSYNSNTNKNLGFIFLSLHGDNNLFFSLVSLILFEKSSLYVLLEALSLVNFYLEEGDVIVGKLETGEQHYIHCLLCLFVKFTVSNISF